LIWGTLPIGSSFLAILFVFLLAEPRRAREVIELPQREAESVFYHEVRS
jgi:hypothetical protein